MDSHLAKVLVARKIPMARTGNVCFVENVVQIFILKHAAAKLGAEPSGLPTYSTREGPFLGVGRARTYMQFDTSTLPVDPWGPVFLVYLAFLVPIDRAKVGRRKPWKRHDPMWEKGILYFNTNKPLALCRYPLYFS